MAEPSVPIMELDPRAGDDDCVAIRPDACSAGELMMAGYSQIARPVIFLLAALCAALLLDLF